MAAVDEAAAAAAAAAAATDDGKKGVLLFVLKANKSDGGDLAPGLSKSIPCLLERFYFVKFDLNLM